MRECPAAPPLGRCGWLARDDKGTWKRKPLMGFHGQHGDSCLCRTLQHVPLPPQRLWTSALQPVSPSASLPCRDSHLPTPWYLPQPGSPAGKHNYDYRPTLGRKRSSKEGHIVTSCPQVQGKRRLRGKGIKEERGLLLTPPTRVNLPVSSCQIRP